VRLQLLGSNPDPRVVGVEELLGKVNYFTGNEPRNWHTNIPTYAKVKYENVYPGVDLVYYGNQRQLEYDFIVAPGVDPSVIKLALQGQDGQPLPAEVEANGDLLVHVASSEIRLRKPLIYQEIDGARREISGAYALLDTQHPAPSTQHLASFK
jgi:hypothetical protein